jgi:hypothetical protein
VSAGNNSFSRGAYLIPGNMLRAHVRAAIEEVTGCGLSVEDPTPDELLVTAAQLGQSPAELIEYIHAPDHEAGWAMPSEFARWVKARREL